MAGEDPQDTSPAAALARARAEHMALAAKPRALNLTTPWSPVGPLQVQTAAYGAVTGRVTAIALDPTDTTNNTVYLGTSGGGVWKSSNAASAQPAFTPLTDRLPVFSANAGTSVIPSLSIGALMVQPGLILAGTGDPNDAADSYYGAGILQSTDGGATWAFGTNSSGSFTGEGVAGFAQSTTATYLVVAAVSSSAESATVQHDTGVRGLYFSTNSGGTWALATIMDGSTVVQSRTSSYSSAFRGNAATSVVWNPLRKKFYAAIRAHGYYESSDGQTWTRMANQPGAGLSTANCPTRPGDYGLTSCPIFRGALAVQPTSGDLFALTVDAVNNDVGLWQDTCAKSGSACANSTVAWGTQLDATPMEDGNGVIPQGDYNLALAAVPAAMALSTADTLLFAGAGDLYRCSLAGGCSLRNTTNATTGCAAPAGVAPAQHAIAWGMNLSNSAAPAVYFGNDGGLWRSLDGVNQQAAVCSPDDATHFTNLNTGLGSLAEVSSVASHPTDPNVLLAALGANGSAASTTAAQASASAAWMQLGTGESGTVAIDQSTGSTWLAQSGAGAALHTCGNGTACTAADFSGPASIGTAQVGGDESLADAPALLDPALNTNVLLGTCRVWRGPAYGGGTWSSSDAISPFLAGPAGMACNDADATIRSLAAGGPSITTGAAQNSGSQVLYAGLSGGADGGGSFAGHIYSTASGSTATSTVAWSDLTNNTVTNDTGNRFNTQGFDISSIAVDPSDTTGNTVYATVMGFGVAHVYRSVNGGGTWTNISANLPNAPANSVAVDPNDPLTVYVAMDTGVYVATDITTCAPSSGAGNCWSVLGTALPNAPVLSLVASAGVTLPGASGAGALRAATYGRGIWQVPLVTVGQALAPRATFSPALLTFTTQPVGSTSAAQTLTLTNTGNAALHIGTVSISAGFAETDTCANTELTVNATCKLTVTFSPTAGGAVSGTLQVNSNVSGGYSTVALTGTGQGVPNVSLSPTALTFADTAVNSTSAAMTVTVSNTGTAAATLTTPAITADFNIAGTTCTSTLAAGSTCTVSVNFQPSANTARMGTLTVADSTATHTATLYGTGVGTPVLTYSYTAIYFHSGVVGSSAAAIPFTISNSGTASATISSQVVTGSDFSLTFTSCDVPLLPGATCQSNVTFTPTAIGTRTGSLLFSDSNGAHIVPLTGTGVSAPDVTLSAAALTFPTTPVNGTSAAQVVTVSDVGGFTYLSGEQVIGDFGITSNTCGAYISYNQTCKLTVVFGPTADGTRTGAINITESTGVVHSVLLNGVGRGTPAVSVSATSLAFPVTGVGSTSLPQTVTVSNTGTAALVLSTATITGDFNIQTNTCGASLAAGTSCMLTVAFTPTNGGARIGTLTLTDALSAHTIALSGTGQGMANVSVSPSSLVFATIAVNNASAAQIVTLANTGNASIGLLSPVITGDFSVATTTCGSSIAAGATCTVSVRFTPTADGARTGLLTLADTAAAHTITLSGTGHGTAIVTLAPAAVLFANTAVGATSPAVTVTLANTGTAATALSAPTVTGDFSIVGTTCGGSIGAGGNCTVTLLFTPTAAGTRTGTLSLPDSSDNHTTSLTGTGTAGALTVSLATVSFLDTTINTTSAAKSVTLFNTGNGPLNIAGITASGDFGVSANTCGAALAAGAVCSVSVTFTPTATSARSGALNIVSDSSGRAGTMTTVPLSGNGKGFFNIVLTPAAVDFGTQLVGSTSAVTNVTISNTGSVTGALGGITVSGDFSLKANTCGTSLAAQTGCTVSVVFTPTASGTRPGLLTVTDDAGTQTATLTGTGTAPATDTLSPLSLTFAQQQVNTVSGSQIVTLTNSGDVALTLVSAAIVAGDFTAVNNCGPTVPAHTGCGIAVTFAPKSVGTQTGTLQITDVQRVQTVSLSGTAVSPPGVTLLPSSLSFAATGVGVVGAGQTLTLSNNGGVPLMLTGVTVVGNFGIVAGSSTCSLAVAVPVGGSCSMSIAFLPTGDGARTGTVTVTSNAATQTAQLSGTGIDFTLESSGATSQTVSSGSSAAYPLLLRPLVNTSDAVTYACTGAPAYAKCTVTAQYADLFAISTVTVTVLTGTATKSVRMAEALLPPVSVGLSLLGLPWCLRRRRSALRNTLLAVLAIAVLAATQGCGSGRVVPDSGDGSTSSGSGGTGTTTTTTTVTPTGTYNLTVSATAAGVMHTVPLTLIVK